jgi:hypothetical protein
LPSFTTSIEEPDSKSVFTILETSFFENFQLPLDRALFHPELSGDWVLTWDPLTFRLDPHTRDLTFRTLLGDADLHTSEIVMSTASGMAAAPTSVERLRRDLDSLFTDEPLEDGVPHPVERFLIEEFRKNSRAASVVCSLAKDRHFKQRVNLVLCLGRIPFRALGGEALALIRDLLESDLLVVRDAAARAVELWEVPAALQLLAQHNETTPWLADYMRRVAASSS